MPAAGTARTIGAAAVADLDPALGGDLRVGLADHAAGDVERLGEHARGGQAGARGGAAAGDRGADRVLELGAQRLGALRSSGAKSSKVARFIGIEVALSEGPLRTVPCSAMSDMPELRDGPPWAMEEMILAEPGWWRRSSPRRPRSRRPSRSARAGRSCVVGCGTSEHAAMAGAALLGARARDAFEASLDPQDGGVLIAVSHEAGTAATLAALEARATAPARS